jgi:hypothetical protein
MQEKSCIIAGSKLNQKFSSGALYWMEVELFLNLAWLSVSMLLLTWWARSIVQGSAKAGWSAAIALGLLLVLLFPVISMTDDLVAMSTPAEVEHMLRRGEAPLHAGSVDLVHPAALISLVIPGPGLSVPHPSSVQHPLSATLLAGFVRAVGVRPPPALHS